MHYRVISADNHVVEPPHTFVDRVPRSLRDRVPQVRRGEHGGEGWSFDGKPPRETFTANDTRSGGHTWDMMPKGRYDGAAHLADMELDGIDAAVLFSSMAGRYVYTWADREAALACFQAYNDWLLDEFCGVNPKRLVGMCLIPTNDGEGAMLQEAERVLAKGARGICLPYYPKRPLHDPYYDPLWKVLADTGVVASIHNNGSSLVPDSPAEGVEPTTVRAGRIVMSYLTAAGPLTYMIFSEVFERFPRLKVLDAEVNMGWVPFWVQQMHTTIDQPHRKGANWYPHLAITNPEKYVGENLFFTALDDFVGFRLAKDDPRLAAAAMWSIDYPHPITLWPKSQQYIADLTAGMDEATKYNILAGNAIRVFHLAD